jgi:hypothetical protein
MSLARAIPARGELSWEYLTSTPTLGGVVLGTLATC